MPFFGGVSKRSMLCALLKIIMLREGKEEFIYTIYTNSDILRYHKHTAA